MVKSEKGMISVSGLLPDILSDFGVITTNFLQNKEIPNDLICNTLKLAFEIAGVDIMKLITCDVDLTEELLDRIEKYKKSLEEEKE